MRPLLSKPPAGSGISPPSSRSVSPPSGARGGAVAAVSSAAAPRELPAVARGVVPSEPG
eukprot:CAMPEP_0118948806 /NCGR_PEP_ID=MMETSP1169-20130426/48486_1 /TAXON_ID=36882 /ORGANISM="Pyramimonas obovata, Strain CCMP722" /LENGTH=58 /DNA_ID=CAMNT_0006895319 /DNA_START=253 /DNA_END=425 /DNA_ORIENTATION=-